MISAQTTRRRPVSGSSISPRRPKSISATSPGALSPIRTVAGLRLRQPRRTMNRLNDVYETRQPRPASSSWMRVSCNRSASQPSGGPQHSAPPDGTSCSSLGAGPSRASPASTTASMYLRTVARDSPVPVDIPPLAHARLPATHHFCYLHSRHLPVRHSGAQGGQSPGEVVYSSWRSLTLLVHSSWRLTQAPTR